MNAAPVLVEQQQPAPPQPIGKFENSFTEVTNASEEPKSTVTVNAVSKEQKSTDLFGAVPFSGSAKVVEKTLPTLAPPVKPPGAIKAAPVATAYVPTLQIVTKNPLKPPAMEAKAVQSQPAQDTLAPIGASVSKLNRNQMQKSNSKLKSKVAKKYEVDESDDEVDVLLDQSNDNEDEQIFSEQVDLKKKKKDKKVNNWQLLSAYSCLLFLGKTRQKV